MLLDAVVGRILKDDLSVIKGTPASREIWLLLVLILINLIFYFCVIPIGIPDPDSIGIGQGLPPSFTARAAIILVGLILCLRLIQLILNPAVTEVVTSDAGIEAISTESVSGSRNIGGISCALVFAFILLPATGYYLASVVMIAALIWIMGERRWLYVTGQSAAVTALIWLLFDRIFSIKLPPGWLIGG